MQAMRMSFCGKIDFMTQQDILQKTAEYIKAEFSDDSSGHDWWHIYRVWKSAITICDHEQADSFIVRPAPRPG
jgi:uncharacterized protein